MDRYIREISLQLSPYCNLKCEYCFCSQDQSYKNSSGVFNRYDELIKFTRSLKLNNELVFNLIGGESSLFCSDIEKAYKKLKKIERYMDVDIRFGTFSNGTNIEGLIDLLDRNILCPESCNISWDGLYSSSDSRIPKDSNQDDEFFKDKISKLGSSKYRDKILVRTALTPNTIDSLSDSVKFLFEVGCRKWEYYFLTDCNEYRSDKFISKFEDQLNKIIEFYKKYNFNWYNIDRMFRYFNIPDSVKYKIKFIGCGNLGEVLHVSRDGKLYPCGFFSDDCKYDSIIDFGDIRDPFNYKYMDLFIKLYNNQPVCDYKSCNNFQCFECPGFVRFRSGESPEYKMTQVCDLRTKERLVFMKQYNKNVKFKDFTEDWNKVGIQQILI